MGGVNGERSDVYNLLHYGLNIHIYHNPPTSYSGNAVYSRIMTMASIASLYIDMFLRVDRPAKATRGSHPPLSPTLNKLNSPKTRMLTRYIKKHFPITLSRVLLSISLSPTQPSTSLPITSPHAKRTDAARAPASNHFNGASERPRILH